MRDFTGRMCGGKTTWHHREVGSPFSELWPNEVGCQPRCLAFIIENPGLFS